MDEKRVLLKKPIELQLNDFIEEVDRFNSKNYTIWKIITLDPHRNYMKLECMESSYYAVGYTCHADVLAHYSHGKCRSLTYYYTNKHPFKVLYGSNKK